MMGPRWGLETRFAGVPDLPGYISSCITNGVSEVRTDRCLPQVARLARREDWPNCQPLRGTVAHRGRSR